MAENTENGKMELTSEEQMSWSDMPSIREIIEGLRAPRTSGEYRRARLAIERLQAPLLATIIPIVIVIVLIVVTATVHTSKQVFQLDIASEPEQAEVELEEEPQPEDTPEIVAVDPDAPIVDVSIDTPIPSMSSMTPSAAPSTAPTKGLVQAINSPVHMVTGAKTRALGEGSSFGSIIGDGTGGGGGGVPAGYLIGEMFDFKRDAEGNDIAGWNPGMYWGQAKKLLNGGQFGAANESHVYKIPVKVALNKIFIEQQDANNGPKAFGVGDKMKPSGWLAHYAATLTSRVDGKFRFIGYFDDCMICMINGKVVLEANWAATGASPMAVTGWKSPVGASPYNHGGGYVDIVGDWFELKKGQDFRFDICIGERPGGLISGRLLIEKEGAEYKKDSKGRPIWPLFSSRRLSPRELQKINKDNAAGKYQIAPEISSIFILKDAMNEGKGKKKKASKPAVDVDVDI